MSSPWAVPNIPQPSTNDDIYGFTVDLSEELVWSARFNFYTMYGDTKFERVLMFIQHCWQTGTHTYFVPVDKEKQYATIERHFVSKPGAWTEVCVLYWHEFERLYPKPAIL